MNRFPIAIGLWRANIWRVTRDLYYSRVLFKPAYLLRQSEGWFRSSSYGSRQSIEATATIVQRKVYWGFRVPALFSCWIVFYFFRKITCSERKMKEAITFRGQHTFFWFSSLVECSKSAKGIFFTCDPSQKIGNNNWVPFYHFYLAIRDDVISICLCSKELN